MKLTKKIIVLIILVVSIIILYVNIYNKNNVSFINNKLTVDLHNIDTYTTILINDNDNDISDRLDITGDDENNLFEIVNDLKINFTLNRSKLNREYFSDKSPVKRERFYLIDIVNLKTGQKFCFRVAKISDNLYEGRYYVDTPLLFSPFNKQWSSYTNIYFEFDDSSAHELYNYIEEIFYYNFKNIPQ